ncbi:hypothetical protein ACIBP4_29050 [Micromonospora maritima]|uniref:Uncharacterized protein n=1 Tax=Micromonospora maritima TaxID=986711 RepID=A0ABW7ZW92_9ACTN
MTARQPGAAESHLGRRLAWARRENERRRRAYETAARAWRRRAEHLDRLRIEADGFHGCALPGTALPVPLHDGEVVYRILPTVELVEATARHLPGLPVPDLALAGRLDPTEGPLPAGLRVVDSGAAVVTDRRVAFVGRDGHRDWPLRDLRGPAHHPDRPVTLLHRADGGTPSGLRMPAAGAPNARFYLTLAHAEATGAREVVVADVEALAAAHRAARPRPPRPLGPADAPVERTRPQRLVAAGVAAALVLLGATSAGTWPATAESTRPTAGAASAAGSTVAPRPGVTATPDAPPTDPPASGSRHHRPPPAAPRPDRASAAPPTAPTAPAAPAPAAPPAGTDGPPATATPDPPTASGEPTPSTSPTGEPSPTGSPSPPGEPSPSATSVPSPTTPTPPA